MGEITLHVAQTVNTEQLQHCTQTAGSADVKVRSILHGRNNITCSTDCKYRTAATLHTEETYKYPWERPGTHCTGGWVGPTADLDGRKISFPPGFDPGQSSP